MPKHLGGGTDLLEVLGPLLALIGVAIYLGLALRGRHPGMRRRCLLWVAGSLAAVAAISGPLASAAETSYVAHMAAHVLLGMLAPLLLVLAAPITLLLRSLPVANARQLSRVLASLPVRILTEPSVAAVLSVGGLWLLYTTGLYAAMHHHSGVHLLVHAHLFIQAGDKLTLRDNKASNATFHNHRKLEPGSSRSVKLGDVISFGALDLELMDAARVYEILRSGTRTSLGNPAAARG